MFGWMPTCREGGDGELGDCSVSHAGVDRDHANVTLVTEANVGDDQEDVRPRTGGRLDIARGEAAVKLFVDDEGDDVEYGQDADGAGHSQKVDLLRVAEGQYEEDAARGHGEVSVHVPVVAEGVAVERGEEAVELVANNDEEGDASAEGVDDDARGGEPSKLFLNFQEPLELTFFFLYLLSPFNTG